ncbi:MULTISPECIES: acyl-CoA thioesterase domain-containing protein [Rhodococcus erythropolis group]|uniref:acyl-CoA thioesterase domain-containing protein n=1 Tax=Rhodococcus erythropolis group TaxID=2840174 RepID=UPI0009B8BAD8|nr:MULTISPECIES: acyl-CoA thioesterase domain-containing protein [Rhodococcus erythropolis group]QXC46720.1 thioesterase family protein [Rhodococcus qingshengii]
MAFFSAVDGGSLQPEQLSISPWSRSQIGGYAICGTLARAIERSQQAVGFTPVRLTVDLFTPVRTELLDTRSVIVRSGPRIEVIDSDIVQNGQVMARASALFVAVGDEPQGELWHSNDPLPDAPDTVDVVAPPVFKSGDGPWSGDFSAHQNSERKSVWQNFPPLIAGEVMSPFQRAALMAETTSLVCHWGTAGAGFINVDTTLALSRLPVGSGLGLRADSQVSENGISVGTATMFDRLGHLGNCTVTAIANARRQVDLGSR